MKNRALFCALIIALSLTACDGHMPRIFGGGASLECDGTNQCKVDVMVTGCAAGGTQISVNHPKVGVKKGKHNVDIHWNLLGNDYEFPDRAIRFKTGASQFDTPDGNKNNYKLRDLNTVGGEFEYSITVVKKGGAPCATKDPIIINDY